MNVDDDWFMDDHLYLEMARTFYEETVEFKAQSGLDFEIEPLILNDNPQVVGDAIMATKDNILEAMIALNEAGEVEEFNRITEIIKTYALKESLRNKKYEQAHNMANLDNISWN